jgi:signal peptidase II
MTLRRGQCVNESLAQGNGERSRTMILKLLSVSSAVIIIDRLTKYILLKKLSEGDSVGVVPGIFHITLVLNSGAAFGLFKGRSAFFTVLTALVIAFICFYIVRGKCKDLLMLTALGLILGGAAGNLIDRAAFGHVIDFLDFRIWPVFNVADASITVGAFILAVRLIRLRNQ